LRALADQGLFVRIKALAAGGGDDAQDLFGSVQERDVLEAALDLGPFVTQSCAKPQGILFKGLVQENDEVKGRRVGTNSLFGRDCRR
jgi:hypothetical protein